MISLKPISKQYMSLLFGKRRLYCVLYFLDFAFNLEYCNLNINVFKVKTLTINSSSNPHIKHFHPKSHAS